MKLLKPSDYTEIQKMELEDEFFSQPFLMSYSGLNKLLFSPTLFYQHYILKQRDDVTDKPMVEGKLLHCLLLNPEEFENEFLLMSSDLPSEGPRKILDKLYEKMKSEEKVLAELTEEDAFKHPYVDIYNDILEILKEQNLYQSLKTDEQRLDKMLTVKNMTYLDHKFQAEVKILVDQDMYDFAKTTVDYIKNNHKIMELMGFVEDSLLTNIEKHNELNLVSLEFDDFPFGLRGIIDNLVVDYNLKEIRINDLKKTSKSITLFEESIEYYNYWMQAALYAILIDHIKLTTFGVDYPVVFRFIVVDPYMQIAPIRISDETLETWKLKLKTKLEEAAFHFKEKDFRLPYKFLRKEHVI